MESLVAAAGVGIAALFGLRTLVRWIVRQLAPSPGAMAAYQRYDSVTYAVFLLLLLGDVGIRLSIPLLYGLGLVFLAAQLTLIAVLWKAGYQRNPSGRSPTRRLFLFLVSGMAALIYQVVWQRALFTAYGANIESVTIIVSLFMFGLGIGSLLGGKLAEKFSTRSLEVFVICEAAIGCFGVASLPLIRWVSDATVHGSLLTLSAMTYALLCVPTALMGATLPVLVGYLHRYTHHIGQSVGVLYCLNTLGSAIASLLTVDVLFRLLGQQNTILVAAGLNFLVAGGVLQSRRRLAHPPAPGPPTDQGGAGRETEARRYSISYPVALVLAGAIGYVSLSQEILWMRAIAYASGGIPQVFGHVLGFFLIGVAGGALLGKEVCRRNRMNPLTFIAGMLVATAVTYYFALPLISVVIATHWAIGLLASYLLVGLVAFCLGGALPVLCHFGGRADTPAGVSVSHIYMANILGSTAGPLLTGFLLLNHWTLERNVLYLTVLCLILFIAIMLGTPIRGVRLTAAGIAGLAVIALTTLHDPLYRRLLERLQFEKEGLDPAGYRHVVQNRSGIIAVAPNEEGDIIYGGGVYDGGFNVDPLHTWNGITRAYMYAALHPAPEEVLEVGLSSGSWTWVVAAHPGVKRLTVVEINPGYPALIEQYRPQGALLTDPRVHIVFDDGRRWLKRHLDARFDFILMNTTFHWRSNVTNLLSREFLELCRAHLKAGGVIYFNATGSEDAVATAASVFRHVTRYHSFVAAGDLPFGMTIDQRRENLLKFRAGGRPFLDPGDPATGSVLEKLAASDLHDYGDEFRRRRDLRIITDDNMVPEFKTTSSRIGNYYRWCDSSRTWNHFHL